MSDTTSSNLLFLNSEGYTNYQVNWQRPPYYLRHTFSGSARSNISSSLNTQEFIHLGKFLQPYSSREQVTFHPQHWVLRQDSTELLEIQPWCLLSRQMKQTGESRCIARLLACPEQERCHIIHKHAGSSKDTIFTAKHWQSVTKVEDDEDITEGSFLPLLMLLPTALLVDRADPFLKGEIPQPDSSFWSCSGGNHSVGHRVCF